ncbi:MFS transporter [Pseudohyphozyma bogoriensis]|nr:MFS transporter [Pseudohyphozyma bogoriensis]
MSITNLMFTRNYAYGKNYTTLDATQVSTALAVGAILGQICIGIVCDRVGRKAGIIVSTFCIVLGTVLIISTTRGSDNYHGFLWMMTICRGLVGFGVGGEYPSSSAAASEAINEKTTLNRAPCLIPPVIVFFFRIRMIDSRLYRKYAIKSNPPYALVAKHYWKSLIGTSVTWFLNEFIVLANAIYAGDVISDVIQADWNAPHAVLIKDTAEWQLLWGVLIFLGVPVGAALVKPMGPRNLMIAGFGGYLVFGLVLGLCYEKAAKTVPGFVILYAVFLAVGNAGPGSMLNLVSTESYATPVRGTCYGFSAAVGKIGAVVGVETFLRIRTNVGTGWPFIMAAIVGAVGMIISFFFIRNDISGDLGEEDERFNKFLAAQGWTGERGPDEYAHLCGEEDKEWAEYE